MTDQERWEQLLAARMEFQQVRERLRRCDLLQHGLLQSVNFVLSSIDGAIIVARRLKEEAS